MSEIAAELVAVCSAGPRPSVHNNHSKGSQFWRRDVWHIRSGDSARTLCGRDCSEWLVMDGVTQPDHNCCTRCATRSPMDGRE